MLGEWEDRLPPGCIETGEWKARRSTDAGDVLRGSEVTNKSLLAMLPGPETLTESPLCPRTQNE